MLSFIGVVSLPWTPGDTFQIDICWVSHISCCPSVPPLEVPSYTSAVHQASSTSGRGIARLCQETIQSPQIFTIHVWLCVTFGVVSLPWTPKDMFQPDICWVSHISYCPSVPPLEVPSCTSAVHQTSSTSGKGIACLGQKFFLLLLRLSNHLNW
jgi:hypothetical protein